MPFVCHALFFYFILCLSASPFLCILFRYTFHTLAVWIVVRTPYRPFYHAQKAGRQLHSQPGAFASNPLLAFCFHNGFSFEFLHHKATCDLRLCVCNVLFRNGDRTSSSSAVWKLKYIKCETLFFLIQAKQMAAKLANKFCCF